MTLYEIDNRMASLIDSETGEVVDYDAFIALDMARQDKLENTVCLLKNWSADVEAIKNEISTLQKRKKSIEGRHIRLLEHLETALAGQKFETPRCAVSYRSSTAVEVADESSAVRWLEHEGRDDCLRYKAPEISKGDLKSLLQSGVEVPGCSIVTRQNIQIK